MNFILGQLIWVKFIKGKQPARVLEKVGENFLRVRKFRVATGEWTKTIIKVEPHEIIGAYDGPMLIEKRAGEGQAHYLERRKYTRKIHRGQKGGVLP